MHLFGNVAPVEEIEALGRARAGGRRAGRGRDPPRRAAPARWARPRPSPSTRPRTSARWATAAPWSPTTTRSPSACASCASTARATRSHYQEVGYNSRLDEIQAALLRVDAPRARRLGRRPPRRRAPPTPRRGWASSSTLPVAVEGADPAWHLYVDRATSGRTRWPRRSPARASGRAPTTARPSTSSPRMAPWAAGAALPGTEQPRARTWRSPWPDPVGASRSAEVVGAVQ